MYTKTDAKPVENFWENGQTPEFLLIWGPKVAPKLHEPRIFYPNGHWHETVTNAHVSAHFR